MRKMTKNDLLEFCASSEQPVIVLRGVSGSGKSTLARWLAVRARSRSETMGPDQVVSADAYFVRDREYCFRPDLLPMAHAKCLREFERLLSRDVPIVVDNTNTTNVEAAPYMALAAAHGSQALLLTIPTPAEIAGPRNEHGVPMSTVQAQAERIAKANAELPPFWDCAVLAEEDVGHE